MKEKESMESKRECRQAEGQIINMPMKNIYSRFVFAS